MAAELKLTKITPVTGTDIDIEGNVIVGTDALPKVLEVKGNLNVGANIDASGDIVADSITVRNTPSVSNELATVGYVNSNVSTRSYITGFEISNNGTDSEHDIDVAVGICRDATDIMPIELTSTLTKRIDAVWAEGNNQGGLESGTTLSNDTWYYLFVIYNSSTGMTDVLFSANITSPNMPSGYDYKRRIRGAVLTDGSANIIGFRQKDNYFDFDRQQEDYGTVSTTNTKTDVGVSVPPNMLGYFTFIIVGGSTYYSWLRRTDCIDIVPTLQYHDLRTGNDQASVVKMVLTDSSSQISYRTDTSGMDLYIYTNGFFDNAEI